MCIVCTLFYRCRPNAPELHPFKNCTEKWTHFYSTFFYFKWSLSVQLIKLACSLFFNKFRDIYILSLSSSSINNIISFKIVFPWGNERGKQCISHVYALLFFNIISSQLFMCFTALIESLPVVVFTRYTEVTFWNIFKISVLQIY